ncbi:MAG: hypothetical protein PHE92_09405 [Candidatus Cloacimonetes bacterium]|nr:hypothetical protein [Candidatus Cloacimonadota bacterium]
MKQNTEYLKNTKVVLTDDLTRYHKSLIKGTLGITVGEATQAFFNSGYNDRFVKVEFPEVTIDVLWKGIELI